MVGLRYGIFKKKVHGRQDQKLHYDRAVERYEIGGISSGYLHNDSFEEECSRPVLHAPQRINIESQICVEVACLRYIVGIRIQDAGDDFLVPAIIAGMLWSVRPVKRNR